MPLSLVHPGFSIFVSASPHGTSLKIHAHLLDGSVAKVYVQNRYSDNVAHKIGPGLRISHFGAMVINPGAVIGKNFTISSGCLVGNAQGKRRGVPRIGDNVIMCSNSIIVGGVTIGDNVMLAPGAFVNFDVPSDSLVIGNPGKIIPKKDASKEYNIYLV